LGPVPSTGRLAGAFCAEVVPEGRTHGSKLLQIRKKKIMRGGVKKREKNHMAQRGPETSILSSQEQQRKRSAVKAQGLKKGRKGEAIQRDMIGLAQRTGGSKS